MSHVLFSEKLSSNFFRSESSESADEQKMDSCRCAPQSVVFKCFPTTAVLNSDGFIHGTGTGSTKSRIFGLTELLIILFRFSGINSYLPPRQ